MGFGIDLRARSRKAKGLFRRAPDPREIADRLARLLPRTFKGWDRKTSQVVVLGDESHAEVLAQLAKAEFGTAHKLHSPSVGSSSG